MSNDHNEPIPFVPQEKTQRKKDKQPKNKGKRQRQQKWDGHIKASDHKKKWYREAG